jgi:hypothetical protein
MTDETKRVVLAALRAYKGDDHLRARHAFGRLSEEQLDEQHGQSGKTRRQIWGDYENHANAVDAAIGEVEAT